MHKTRLLLLEDDPAASDGLRKKFEREGYEVIEARIGGDVMFIVDEAAPDILILEWTPDDPVGPDLCRRLRSTSATANLPIIILTARSDEMDRVRGLEAGADDYVTKPFSSGELVARVGAVLRRARPALSDAVLSYADLEMDVSRYKVRRGGRPVALGPTEFRLLRHLLEHPGRVFSRERLLSTVWGRDSEIELRTIDVHIRRLRNAINIEGSRDIIRTVRAAGYALDDE